MIFVTLKFYTHSVPTERISRYSFFYKPFVPTELILFGKIFYTYSVPTERLSRWSLFLQTFRSYGTLFYLGKFSTHIAFLGNAFIGSLFSTNLSFLWNFILFGEIFYTYSVPTERISRCSLFLQTFRSYGTLFYWGKFSTHIAFLRNTS